MFLATVCVYVYSSVNSYNITVCLSITLATGEVPTEGKDCHCFSQKFCSPIIRQSCRGTTVP